MNRYTYSEARQKLARLLDEAQRDGEVLITRRDGQAFALRPVAKPSSPLEVEGIDLGLSRDEILQAIREGRKFK
jgi:antitoxin Phd